MTEHTVDPHQFLGLEINPRAAALAELVLWIGYLQWHFRTRGQTMPAEPVLKNFKNIQCRDAVLAYDGEPQPVLDAAGNAKSVWDSDLAAGLLQCIENRRLMGLFKERVKFHEIAAWFERGQ